LIGADPERTAMTNPAGWFVIFLDKLGRIEVL